MKRIRILETRFFHLELLSFKILDAAQSDVIECN